MPVVVCVIILVDQKCLLCLVYTLQFYYNVV